MVCPFCNNQETSVVDSRKNSDGSIVRRRRNCEVCKKRFTSYETAVIQLIVRKKNRETQDFDYNAEGGKAGSKERVFKDGIYNIFIKRFTLRLT